MKEYKISCENAEVKAEAIKLFEALGYRDLLTKDKYLGLVVHNDGTIQSVSNYCLTDNCTHSFKQITIEKLRKMAKPTECLVKTDNGWEYKVLPKSLVGDAVKIPKKANFAVECALNGLEYTVVFYKQADGGDYRFDGETEWRSSGCGVDGRTTIWQRTEKSKFIVKTKFGYEFQDLPKDTPVTWHCIPLVDGVSESDQIGFYELCDKVEAVDFDGAKWMRENTKSYSRSLAGCFTWDDTQQGFSYWNLINNLIK